MTGSSLKKSKKIAKQTSQQWRICASISYLLVLLSPFQLLAKRFSLALTFLIQMCTSGLQLDNIGFNGALSHLSDITLEAFSKYSQPQVQFRGCPG